LIVDVIMRRRAMGGQGANVCDLGRAGSGNSNLAPESDHFRVLAKLEINVIARMAPMKGIQKPFATYSGLAMAGVTP
jgi:hypothetical protein